MTPLSKSVSCLQPLFPIFKVNHYSRSWYECAASRSKNTLFLGLFLAFSFHVHCLELWIVPYMHFLNKRDEKNWLVQWWLIIFFLCCCDYKLATKCIAIFSTDGRNKLLICFIGPSPVLQFTELSPLLYSMVLCCMFSSIWWHWFPWARSWNELWDPSACST